MNPLSRLLRLSRRLSTSANPNPNPTPKLLRSTVRSLKGEEDVDKLVSDFKKLSDSPQFRNKISLHEFTVRRLASAGRLDAVECILEHQKLYPDFAREGFAARIISLYGLASMIDHAVSLFRSLPSLQCPRTVLSFNALLTAAARSGDPGRTAALMREMLELDPSIAPNDVTYNILISSFCGKEDFDSALETLNTMERRGISPNVVTFNTLLNGFYGKGRFLEGERIWAQMGEYSIQPDIWSFNAKLKGLVSEARISEAVKLFGELRRVGIKPDTFTFNTLINGHCQARNWQEAMRVYIEMGESKCAPNFWTFKTMISSLFEAGEFDLAGRLCNESVSYHFFLDLDILQGVVDGLVKISKFDKAKRLVKHVRYVSNGKKKLRMPLPCLAL